MTQRRRSRTCRTSRLNGVISNKITVGILEFRKNFVNFTSGVNAKQKPKLAKTVRKSMVYRANVYQYFGHQNAE